MHNYFYDLGMRGYLLHDVAELPRTNKLETTMLLENLFVNYICKYEKFWCLCLYE